MSRTEQLWSYSRLLSHATPAYIPALLQCTFPCYSSVHSRATPVHTPVLLQSTTGLDRTHAWLDMGSSCHSSVTYVPISHHLYLLVLSLFPAHIYFHLPISTSVVFPSHWQWLSLGTYCPLSSLCHIKYKASSQCSGLKAQAHHHERVQRERGDGWRVQRETSQTCWI